MVAAGLEEGTPVPSRKLARSLGTLGFLIGQAEDAGVLYEATRWFGARYAVKLYHDGYGIQTRSLSASDTTGLREISFLEKDRSIELPRVPAGLYSETVRTAKKLLEA
jgi:hypothetical protein